MKKIVLNLILVCLPGFSTDVFNLGLRVNLEYADLKHHCKLSSLFEPYRLAGEFDQGKVYRAVLRKDSRFLPTELIELNPDEVRGLEIRSESNLVWIRKMVVSSGFLKKLIFSGEGFGPDACLPPKGVETLSPSEVLFDFGLDSVGYVLPHLIHSQEVILRGTTLNSEPFRIKLSLTLDRR